jgi:hypothetical protein
MNTMTTLEAADILDPATTRKALRPYAFDCDYRKAVVQKACTMGAKALREAAERSEDKNENNPLTLDELRNMYAQPAWIQEIQTGRGYWSLVGIAGENGVYLTTIDSQDDYAAFSMYGKTWLAYRREPQEEGNHGTADA